MAYLLELGTLAKFVFPIFAWPLCTIHTLLFRMPSLLGQESTGHLTNYGQKANFWTFFIFSHGGNYLGGPPRSHNFG
jgi:hypothetical protein